MKLMTLVLGTAGLATALGGAAFAQQAMGGHDPLGNATITRAEAQAKSGEMFDRMDLNKDGKLDAADRAVRIGQRFDAMDANRDGTLSRQEFIDAHQHRMGERKDDHPGPGGSGMMDHAGKRGHHMGGERMMGMMRGMDANGDHAITRDEFNAGALKRFDAADTNKDGKLTPEERRAAFRNGMKMHRQHMRGMGGHEMGGPGHDMGSMPPPAPGK